MKNLLKYVALMIIVVAIYSCESEKVTKGRMSVGSEYAKNELQKQLDEEFGPYEENVEPEDRDYYKAYDSALTLWKVPFHELNVKTSYGNAHVIVSGRKNAEPLVLLHGMNSSSTMWYPNIQAFSKNYRVYAIDYLLEPGKSEMNREVKDMGDVMNWYNEIFDQLKLEKFSLIGASKGGWMSIYIALQQQSRIKSIVLLSPPQTFRWIQPGTKIVSNINYSILPVRNQLQNVLETLSINVNKIEKAYINQYYINTQIVENNKFILKMTPYSKKELNTLTMPVLLLIGDHDIINNEKSIEKAKTSLPHCEAAIVKNAGHFLSIDQAVTVNRMILNFLDTHLQSEMKETSFN
jgi:pimeloyl-ACP methyl ester carboxylesterase